MAPRSPLPERLAKAEEWIAGHEARCEERYAAIQATVAALHEVIEGWRKGAWALVLAVLGLGLTIIGSLLVQIYALEPLRVAPPPAVPITAPPALHRAD
jgi:hypothetical protein